MKRSISIICAAMLLFCALPQAQAEEKQPSLNLTAKAALLIEEETGTVLYEENADTPMEPASVTKIMTMLLIMEAVENGQVSMDDMISVSIHAREMGGSGVYLEEGEQFTLHEMLKAIAIESANDACVAVAEHLCGSELTFVDKMNERAAQLGMTNTHFVNCNGLPASGHLTTARDIARMSQALLAHDEIKEYTTIWMDTFRDGTFGLNNTNRLIRFYEGATGLKTGFTNGAKFCISATAERDGMGLIAVVLGAPTSDDRFEDAKAMLNYGFSNYAMVDVYPSEAIPAIPVVLGECDYVQPVLDGSARVLIEKSQKNAVTCTLELASDVQAPIDAGQKLGRMVIAVDGEELQSIPLVSAERVEKLGISGVFSRLLKTLLMG